MGNLVHLAPSRTQFNREQAFLAVESLLRLSDETPRRRKTLFVVAFYMVKEANSIGELSMTTERLAELTDFGVAAVKRSVTVIVEKKLFVRGQIRSNFRFNPERGAELASTVNANANAKQHYRETSEDGSFGVWREEFGRICRPGNTEIGPTPKKENQQALVAFGQRLAAELDVDERAVAAATCERFSKETEDPKVRAEKILPFMVPLLWKFEPSVRHALRRPPAAPARSYHVELAAPSVAENSAFARQALASLAGGAS